MGLSKENIMTYCHIDEEEEAKMVMEAFVPAAKQYLDNAIDNKEALTENNEQYCLMILLLINHWYNNRDSVVIGTVPAEMPFLWRSLMQQLQN